MADFLNATNTQTSKPVFTPEGLQALMADFQQMQDMLSRMSGVHSPILSYLSGQQPLAESMLAQPTQHAMAMAQNSAQTAGVQRGISDRNLAGVDAQMRAQEPDLLAPLGQYARQYGGGINSLVDPRLASFLKPDNISSSTSTPSGLQTATGILNAVGPLASLAAGTL